MALVFDGDNDYVSVGTVDSTDDLALAASDFTIAAWIRADTSVGDLTRAVIVKGTDAVTTNGWGFYFNPVGKTTITSGGTVVLNSDLQDLGGGFADDQWVHLAAVVTDTTADIYVNGWRAESETGSGWQPPSASSTVNIGTIDNTGAEYLGAIEDLGVWDSALTFAQIQDLVFAPCVSPPAPVARWLFREIGGTTAADLTGNWNGTLTNGPTWLEVELPNEKCIGGSLAMATNIDGEIVDHNQPTGVVLDPDVLPMPDRGVIVDTNQPGGVVQ